MSDLTYLDIRDWPEDAERPLFDYTDDAHGDLLHRLTKIVQDKNRISHDMAFDLVMQYLLSNVPARHLPLSLFETEANHETMYWTSDDWDMVEEFRDDLDDAPALVAATPEGPLLDGYHRWAAFKLEGRDTVPVIAISDVGARLRELIKQNSPVVS